MRTHTTTIALAAFFAASVLAAPAPAPAPAPVSSLSGRQSGGGGGTSTTGSNNVDPSNNGGTPLKARQSSAPAAGPVNDGLDTVAADSFSIIFGASGRNDDGSRFGGDRQVTLTSGADGQHQQFNLTCQEGKKDYTGDLWTTMNFAALPYGVDVHAGNTCFQTPDDYYYNTWVNYANQHINVPSDSRCKSWGSGSMGRRCILPIKPQ